MFCLVNTVCKHWQAEFWRDPQKKQATSRESNQGFRNCLGLAAFAQSKVDTLAKVTARGGSVRSVRRGGSVVRDERNRGRGSFWAGTATRRERSCRAFHCAGGGRSLRDQRVAASLVDRRFVLPFSRGPPEPPAALPRVRQLRRPDDRSGHVGAFCQHRRDDRR